MRAFHCVCGNRVFFENDRCLRCGRTLAFDPAARAVRPLRDGDRFCASHAAPGTCNWLAVAPDAAFCAGCALNEIVPDLSDPRRAALYYEVEKAKRRLLFTLFSLGLPVEGRALRADGLAFQILADGRLDGEEWVDDAVATGHAEGTITINLLEADPHLRERMRIAMNEPYRTLLGHFRHEAGHYYWRRLVDGTARGAEFGRLFGDAALPYRESLDAYYRDGAPAGWRDVHLSAYCASHPLEDFAECWAHYLHMVDTLETAASDRLVVGGRAIGDPAAAGAPGAAGVEALIDDWRELARAMNDLNRSMGLDDAYPFALPPPVVDKLRFVHRLVGECGERAP